MQEYHRKLFELGDVCVGRFQHMDYVSATQEGAITSVEGTPRFTVTLLDAAYTATRSVTSSNTRGSRIYSETSAALPLL